MAFPHFLLRKIFTVIVVMNVAIIEPIRLSEEAESSLICMAILAILSLHLKLVPRAAY